MTLYVDTQVINKLRQLLWLLPVVILIDMQVVIPITRTSSISYITYIIHHILLAISHHKTHAAKTS